MSWHYQIVRHGGEHPYYGLHEVYEYPDAAVAWAASPAGPTTFACHLEEGPESITEALSRALADASKYPVLEVDK